MGISINTRPFNDLGPPSMSLSSGFDPNGRPNRQRASFRRFLRVRCAFIPDRIPCILIEGPAATRSQSSENRGETHNLKVTCSNPCPRSQGQKISNFNEMLGTFKVEPSSAQWLDFMGPNRSQSNGGRHDRNWPTAMVCIFICVSEEG
jgi:hypothetical protein